MKNKTPAQIKKEKRERWRSGVMLFGGIGGLASFVFILATMIFWAGGVQEKVKRIPEMEEKLDAHFKHLNARIDDLYRFAENKILQDVEIGLIDEKKIREKMNLGDVPKTSIGIPYYLDHRICEVNVESDRWALVGGVPRPGSYFQIRNDNSSVSWCLSVGEIYDDSNRNRPLIVSNRVAQEIHLSEFQGVKKVPQIVLIEEPEWRKKKEMVELFDEYAQYLKKYRYKEIDN